MTVDFPATLNGFRRNMPRNGLKRGRSSSDDEPTRSGKYDSGYAASGHDRSDRSSRRKRRDLRKNRDSIGSDEEESVHGVRDHEYARRRRPEAPPPPQSSSSSARRHDRQHRHEHRSSKRRPKARYPSYSTSRSPKVSRPPVAHIPIARLPPTLPQIILFYTPFALSSPAFRRLERNLYESDCELDERATGQVPVQNKSCVKAATSGLCEEAEGAAGTPLGRHCNCVVSLGCSLLVGPRM
ncbi:unnamed protein product [Notodromas monacha]|uniref:Uncharacterized protein n=1 Tax=Notodromas monacha TaxID=399045 RepID=A0A7R9BEN7_9CRUS|nr:unnamed protein product [Notodromas monacha]CAG0913098.1 unnamed protein product [Notodromas monacha]